MNVIYGLQLLAAPATTETPKRVKFKHSIWILSNYFLKDRQIQTPLQIVSLCTNCRPSQARRKHLPSPYGKTSTLRGMSTSPEEDNPNILYTNLTTSQALSRQALFKSRFIGELCPPELQSNGNDRQHRDQLSETRKCWRNTDIDECSRSH